MSYIGNTPGVSSQRVVLEETISGSAKSTFTPISGYTLGYVDVKVNGIELDAADFTATDGVTVTLVNAAQVGDTVKIKTWLPRGLSDGYLKVESDARFLKLDGTNSMTGNLSIGTSAYGGQVTLGTGAAWYLQSTGTTTANSKFNLIGWNGSAYQTMLTSDSVGNVGVGTSSPAYRLHVSGTGTGAYIRVSNTTGTYNAKFNVEDTGETSIGSHSSNNLWFLTGNTLRMTLDTSGNLGLGVTPSAWSGYQAFQINKGSIWAPSNNLYLSQNLYYNGSARTYIATAAAAEYELAGGQHLWLIAPSGTAGTSVSLTQAMTLDASGNLLIGRTSGSYTLEVGNGSSDTRARINGNNQYGLAFQNASNSAFWIGSPGADALAFSTGGGTERARIDSNGNLLVGTTTLQAKLTVAKTSAGAALYASQDVATNNGTAYIYQTVAGGNGGQNIGLMVGIQAQNDADRILTLQYFNSGSPIDRFVVQRNGAAYNAGGVYGTISDARVKQDIVDASSQWEDFKKIKFRKYRIIADVETLGDAAPRLMGPVAQELEEAGMSGLVESPVQVDGTELHKQVKLSIMYMKGMKALQEAMFRIEEQQAIIVQLQADVATLKGQA